MRLSEHCVTGRVAVPIHNKGFNENWDCTDFQLKLMENQATRSEAEGADSLLRQDSIVQNKRVSTNRKLLAYVIGVALGDGNLSNPNGRATRLRIICDVRYQSLIKKIRKAIQALLPDNRVGIVRGFRGAVDISCYSNRWEKWLDWKAGKGSKYCQKVSVPRWILRSKEFMIPCLRGLIETDGSVYRDRGYKMVSFVATIPRLARNVMTMLTRLGFQPKLCIFSGEHEKKYTVRIARNVAVLIKTLQLEKTIPAVKL